MHSIESGEGGMDELGSRRQRPDSAGCYAAMSFVDHIVKVADLRVSHQLLQLLDSVFLRKTLQQRLIKGSEVEHVVRACMRGPCGKRGHAMSLTCRGLRSHSPAL